jgi:hypothetical protein
MIQNNLECTFVPNINKVTGSKNEKPADSKNLVFDLTN